MENTSFVSKGKEYSYLYLSIFVDGIKDEKKEACSATASSSGKIVQLDNIPSDCEQLTDEERICDESLSFKVTNETSSGAHRISFMIDSVSYLNYPILRNYLKYSSGNSFLEVPINVQTPAVDILQSQSEVNYSKTGLFWVIGFLLVIVVSLLVGLILFAPQLWEFFKEFI